MSEPVAVHPIVGAIHKATLQDLVVNIMLEHLRTMMGGVPIEGDIITLKDLPSSDTQRQIVVAALKAMKGDDYRIHLSGDMVIIYDTGDGRPLYQRSLDPKSVATVEELDGEIEHPSIAHA